MAKTDAVPVFYRDQDELRERPFTTWTREKCREVKKKLGNFITNGKHFRLFAVRPKIYPVTAADLKDGNFLPVAETISMGELLANVGICGKWDEPAPRHVIKAAQAKVRMYPQVHDTQAVVAHGRWYASERIQVSVVQ